MQWFNFPSNWAVSASQTDATSRFLTACQVHWNEKSNIDNNYE